MVKEAIESKENISKIIICEELIECNLEKNNGKMLQLKKNYNKIFKFMRIYTNRR